MLDFSRISNDKLKYFFLLIWPFGAFLSALTDIRSKSSRVVIFIFWLLFGLSFIPKNQEADSYGYYQEFIQNNDITFSDLKNSYEEYFSFDGEQKEIYTITMVFIVTRLTDNYHILFFAYALIFAFFYMRSFGFLLNDENFKQSFVCLLIAFLFTFSNPIFNINGVRFWTASWISVYGLFKIIVDRDYRYLLIFGITPLIHLSFLSFFIVLIAAVLLVRYEKLWMVVFAISFLSGTILQELLLNYFDIFPKVIQNTINSYASDMSLMERTQKFENMPSYAVILFKLPYYYLNVLVCIIILSRNKINLSIKDKNLFTLILILFSFANFTYAIPSFGTRYFALVIPFIALLLLRIWDEINIKWYIYAIPFVYSYSILYWFRRMVSISEPYLYLSSLPHIVFKYLTEFQL